MHTSKAKQIMEFIHWFPWAGRCSAIPGKQGSIKCNCYLGRQTPSIWMSPPSWFFPQLYMLSMTSYGVEYPFGVSCPGCAPSQLLVHPAEHGELKKSLTSVSATHQQLKHLHIITTVSSKTPKHSPILATVKKFNSIPAETRTYLYFEVQCFHICEFRSIDFYL